MCEAAVQAGYVMRRASAVIAGGRHADLTFEISRDPHDPRFLDKHGDTDWGRYILAAIEAAERGAEVLLTRQGKPVVRMRAEQR